MRRYQALSIFLFLAAFLVFGRLLSADFVQWDDDVNVYENPEIQSLDWNHLAWMFTDASRAMRYKPLTWLSHALIFHFAGSKPVAFHFASVLFHSLNTVLVFLVIRRLLAAACETSNLSGHLKSTDLPAAAGALLWAVNPLRVEPVARATDFTYCLLLFFLMLSLWFYLRGFEFRSQPRLWKRFYWASVVFFALCMLSYPLAFGWALVLLVIDWFPLRRFACFATPAVPRQTRAVLTEKLPFLILGGLLLVTVFARLNPTGIWKEQAPDAAPLSAFAHVMQACYVWAYYLWKPWLPLHLSPVYSTLVDFKINGVFWLCAFLIPGLTLLLILNRHRWPSALALWSAHLVLLVPVLGLTERFHYTSDRYSYVVGVVWAVAVAVVLHQCRLRASGSGAHGRNYWGTTLINLVYAVALMIAVAWAGLTVHQTRVWQNTVVLFEHAIKELGANPYAGEMHCRLAQYLSSQGRKPEALGHYEAALGMFPDLLPALNNLAWARATDPNSANRNGAQAVALGERACALTRYSSPIMLGTLAAAYAEVGRFDQAISTAQKAHDLALAAGQQVLAKRNMELMEVYRTGRPYREIAEPVNKTSEK